jgi:NADPH:quinone reductase-like Zn-dependent oxidoreductase
MRPDLDFERGPGRIDHMIDHRTMDFEARARQITGGPAVELILDAIGGD